MRVGRLTADDAVSLCRDVTKNPGIHSDTVDAVCCKFADARDAVFPKAPKLRLVKKNLDFVQSRKSIATGRVMCAERWTSQGCSRRGSIRGSGPKGVGAL